VVAAVGVIVDGESTTALEALVYVAAGETLVTTNCQEPYGNENLIVPLTASVTPCKLYWSVHPPVRSFARTVAPLIGTLALVNVTHAGATLGPPLIAVVVLGDTSPVVGLAGCESLHVPAQAL
jgi:hypothetical protein